MSVSCSLNALTVFRGDWHMLSCHVLLPLSQIRSIIFLFGMSQIKSAFSFSEHNQRIDIHYRKHVFSKPSIVINSILEENESQKWTFN